MSAMALEAQTEAENLMWVTRTTSDDDDDDVEHASCSSGPSRPEQSSKRKQKAKAKRQTQRRGGKGGRVVKKYAVNFEGRRLQVCFLEMSPHAVTCSARAFVRSLLTFFADFFVSAPPGDRGLGLRGGGGWKAGVRFDKGAVRGDGGASHAGRGQAHGGEGAMCRYSEGQRCAGEDRRGRPGVGPGRLV